MKYLLCGVAAIAMLSACDNTGGPADEDVGEISLRAGDPAEADAVIAAMSLTNSGDGAVSYESKDMDGAKATFSNLSVASGDASSVTAASLVFEGLDMIDGTAAFSKMTLSDISVQDPEMEDGEFTVNSVELVNPTPQLAAWVASSFGAAEPAPFPAPGEIGFAAWSVNGIGANFSDEDGDGGFSMDKFEVRDLVDQKAARAVMSDLNFNFVDAEDGTPVTMSLGSLAMTGLDLGFIEAIHENMGDDEAMTQALIDKMYDEPMDPGYDSISLDSFSAAVAGASFNMPSLDANIERNSAGQPVKFVTKPFSMTLDADPDGGEAGAGLAQGLSMIQYEKIELKAAGVTDYDPATDTLTFAAKDNYLELVDGAKFSFGGKVEGYSSYSQKAADSFDIEELAEGAEPDPMAFQEALAELTLYNFELSIADDSLVNRIFNAAAAQSGEDPEQMRQQAAMMMQMAPMMAQGAGVDMELVTELATAVSAFITDPGTLTIKLAPEEPLSAETLSSMEDPSMLTKEYLGFSATHKN